MSIAYPEAVHLVCWKHVADNINNYLTSLYATKDQKRALSVLFFGRADYKGILDCEDEKQGLFINLDGRQAINWYNFDRESRQIY